MTRRKSNLKRARNKKRPVRAGKSPGRELATGPGGSDAGRPNRHLIVGIGASAGGLQAFKTFFASMPADSGMAFVLVQHLDPEHRSMLVELLSAATTMPVVEAADRMPVEANHVYVIPPNATLRIASGKLQVTKPAPAREYRHPVDTFFSALAQDQEGNAVCIVLSGGGSDGTEGLKAIKEHGGLTMAQAAFDEHAMLGMPTSATATGLVDYVLAIEEMPATLVKYSGHLLEIEAHKGPDGIREDAGGNLAKICSLLRSKLGHDFSQYKEKTVLRRIQRRMQVLQIASTPAYIERLQKGPQEPALLLREMLIGVTHFFRDPAAFEALQTQVVSNLVHNKNADDIVRVWVPACATGEEVYSIAILLKEAVGAQDAGPRFQIFATDIDEHAIAVARAGHYRKSQLADIPDTRRERWFVNDGDRWCPIKEIREMCIFSTHSIIKDPPFSKLDLISCRNLLIYLDAPLQERVIRACHYALLPGGTLFLGTSESVTRQSKLFATVDQKHRIFQRREVPAFVPNVAAATRTNAVVQVPDRSALLTENGIEKSARRIMEKYAPAYVVVDGNHEVLRFSGQTDRYLGPAPGAASLNLFNLLLHRGLRPAARAALAKAQATRHPATHEALAIEVNGRRQFVDLVVEPVADGNAEHCVVAFFDRKPTPDGNGSAASAQTLPAEVLEKELRGTRERLEATIDQLETSTEEMKSANEEYQSVNEELQSTNEELETSKEEMQSINEELQTVNAELNSKNDALAHLNSDLKNLLDSTQIATLFLDRQLRIKNFTPSMTDIFHLRDGDRGRPVTEIVSRLSYDGLRKDAMRAMRDLSVIERLLTIPDDGSSFLMRVRPYRTVDDVIDGTVITFIDVSERTRHEEERAALAAVVDFSQDAIVRHSLDGLITNWNAAAEKIFGYTAAEAVGKPLAILLPEGQTDEMPRILRSLAKGKRVEHSEVGRITKAGQRITISATISPIRDERGTMTAASTIARDITAERQLIRQSEQRLRELIMALPAAVYTTDALGRITFYNQAAVDLAGRVPKIGSDEWCISWKLYWPDGRPMRPDECPMAVTLKENRPIRGTEAIAERPDGTRVPFVPYPTPLRDASGKLVGGVNMLIDITERKDAEKRQQLLIDELNHRVKNTLAAVQSIAAQSLKATSDIEHRNAFDARLIALARTHDLLSQAKWESASLRDLVLEELEPYGSGDDMRIVIEGPDLALKPKVALAFAMAFHELATNAAKYGALSRHGGNVRVTWDVVRASEPSALRLKWTESGGPTVKKRTRKGFGSTVIERNLQLELGGDVRLDFEPGGVVCTMEIPLPFAGG